jgi:hypothetical protein
LLARFIKTENANRRMKLLLNNAQTSSIGVCARGMRSGASTTSNFYQWNNVVDVFVSISFTGIV